MKRWRLSAWCCLALLTAASAVGADRRWEMRLDGFFQSGKTPLTVYARERDGIWITAMGSARAPGRGKEKYAFNRNHYCGDFSAVPIINGKVKGRAKVHMTPDPWIPFDHIPFAVELEIDATSTGSEINGSYKVIAVNSTDQTAAQFKGASGKITGTGTESVKPSLPRKITYQLNLQGAMVGGDPKIGERCLVLRLALDGDRLVSMTHGKLSKKNLVHGEAVAPQAPDAVAREQDRFKGQVVFSTEDLDTKPVTCTVDFDGGTIDDFAVGTYTLTAESEGAEPITRIGSFDGKWKEGAEVAEIDDAALVQRRTRIRAAEARRASATALPQGRRPRLCGRRRRHPKARRSSSGCARRSTARNGDTPPRRGQSDHWPPRRLRTALPAHGRCDVRGSSRRLLRTDTRRREGPGRALLVQEPERPAPRRAEPRMDRGRLRPVLRRVGRGDA